MEKIYELKNALENIGINCELVTDAAWYCIDGKTHYGIELLTDIEDGYAYVLMLRSEYELLFSADKEITKLSEYYEY